MGNGPDDVKPAAGDGDPVGGSSGLPIELPVGTVIEGTGLKKEKVPQGKKIINYVITWTGLMVDE